MISQWFWKGCWILHDIGCWWILDKNGSKWIGDPTPKKVFVKGVQTNEAVLVPHICGNVSKFAAFHWTIPRNHHAGVLFPKFLRHDASTVGYLERTEPWEFQKSRVVSNVEFDEGTSEGTLWVDEIIKFMKKFLYKPMLFHFWCVINILVLIH